MRTRDSWVQGEKDAGSSIPAWHESVDEFHGAL